MKRRTLVSILLAALVCCALMALVDGVIRPGYAVKSAIKLAAFGLMPVLLSGLDRQVEALSLLRPQKRGLLVCLGLGLGVYVLILGGYFLVRSFFDFSSIAGSLTENAGVTKDNFLFVSLYISFVNSLLEEFFFRGFLFTNLRRLAGGGFAYGFSASVFALYHIAMITGWFSPVLYGLVMAGLVAGGIIFNWLNEKLNTLYASWLVHMFANFAINTVGFLLLG